MRTDAFGFGRITARWRSPAAPAVGAVACAPRPTDVIGALTTWRDGWAAAPSGWTMDVGEHSSRSEYEIYSRYNGLAFVMGVPVEEAMRVRPATRVIRCNGVGTGRITRAWARPR